MGLADRLDQQAFLRFAGNDRRAGLAAFLHGGGRVDFWGLRFSMRRLYTPVLLFTGCSDDQPAATDGEDVAQGETTGTAAAATRPPVRSCAKRLCPDGAPRSHAPMARPSGW